MGRRGFTVASDNSLWYRNRHVGNVGHEPHDDPEVLSGDYTGGWWWLLEDIMTVAVADVGEYGFDTREEAIADARRHWDETRELRKRAEIADRPATSVSTPMGGQPGYRR